MDQKKGMLKIKHNAEKMTDELEMFEVGIRDERWVSVRNKLERVGFTEEQALLLERLFIEC